MNKPRVYAIIFIILLMIALILIFTGCGTACRKQRQNQDRFIAFDKPRR